MDFVDWLFKKAFYYCDCYSISNSIERRSLESAKKEENTDFNTCVFVYKQFELRVIYIVFSQFLNAVERTFPLFTSCCRVRPVVLIILQRLSTALN